MTIDDAIRELTELRGLLEHASSSSNHQRTRIAIARRATASQTAKRSRL